MSSWRCLMLWGPEYVLKYISMVSCEKEPVKTGKQDPQLLITQWWKHDSNVTCYSVSKCRTFKSKKTKNNNHILESWFVYTARQTARYFITTGCKFRLLE